MLTAKKNKKKSIYSQILLSIVGFLVLIAISVPLAKNASQRYRINKEIKDLNAEIKSLEEKNSNFIELIDYLESDQFVEEQARLKLNYRKEGEKVLVIKNKNNILDDNGILGNLSGQNKKIDNKSKSNFARWWNYFFKI